METRSQGYDLPESLHVPEAEGKILSLKVLAQKGFQSHIFADRIRISKNDKTLRRSHVSGEYIEVKMKVVLSRESILAAVKRDSNATDLYTWHRRLGPRSGALR